MKSLQNTTIVLALLGCLFTSAHTFAQWETFEVTEGVYLITGSGGNVSLIVGEHRALLVDDKYAQTGELVLAEVKKVTDKPLDLVFNTHWHGDHTGANQIMGEHGAVIIAHENVRKILSEGAGIRLFDSRMKPYSEVALPQITFQDTLSFHLLGDTIRVQHYPGAHTSGDGVLYMTKANILITGDLYFNSTYPFVDVENGGNVVGLSKAIASIVASIDDKTIVIPGHGPLSNRSELAQYQAMLDASIAAVAPLKAKGMSLAEVRAENPFADLNDAWGKGFIKPDTWAAIVYESL